MKIANFKIDNFSKPFIIAELNTCHGGDLELAKVAIKSAKQIGANAVKMQSFGADSLYCEDYYQKNRIAKRMIEKLSLKNDDLKELADFAHGLDLAFGSTAYSNEEAGFLCELGADFLKIASSEANNLPFLSFCATLNIPTIVSTGMCNKNEISVLFDIFDKNKTAFLHCVSVYPARLESQNLQNITALRDEFGGVWGFSDHTQSNTAALVSIGLGAAILERHFTLDRNAIGMDNKMATQKEEFAELVRLVCEGFVAMGSKERILADDEISQKDKMRRFIAASRDLAKGEILTQKDFLALRKEISIDCFGIEEYKSLIGKTLKNDLKKGFLIQKDMVL